MPCPVCLEDVPEASVVRCKAAVPPAQQHVCCRGCLQDHVLVSATVDSLARNAGGVPCLASSSCTAPPWRVEELSGQLEAGTLEAHAAGMRRLRQLQDEIGHYHLPGPNLKERAAAQFAERVSTNLRIVQEADLTLHCPRCAAAFFDFSGDYLVTCSACSAFFCGLCVQDCGGEDARAHAQQAHGGRAAFSAEECAAAHGRYKLGRVAARLRGLAGEPRVQEALLGALAGAHLGDLGVSLAELRAAAGMGAGAAATSAGALVPCPVCLEDVPEASVVRCKAAAPPAQQHFCCRDCLQYHVRASATVDSLARNAGGVPCAAAGCAAPPWRVEELSGQLEAGTLEAFAAGARYRAIDLPRIIRERLEERRRREEECRGAAEAGERVRLARRLVVEVDFALSCPRCATVFQDFMGGLDVHCSVCHTVFCGQCMVDCGGEAEAVAHMRQAHGGYFSAAGEVEAAHRALRLGRVVARLRGLAGVPGVQQALLAELARADLGGVGLSEADVRAELSR